MAKFRRLTAEQTEEALQELEKAKALVLEAHESVKKASKIIGDFGSFGDEVKAEITTHLLQAVFLIRRNRGEFVRKPPWLIDNKHFKNNT